MEKSKVYFTSFRAEVDESPLDKMRRLLKAASMTQMDLNGKFTAIKIHFGEAGNTSYLRSAYARILVDMLKEMGAKPFLTGSSFVKGKLHFIRKSPLPSISQ